MSPSKTGFYIRHYNNCHQASYILQIGDYWIKIWSPLLETSRSIGVRSSTSAAPRVLSFRLHGKTANDTLRRETCMMTRSGMDTYGNWASAFRFEAIRFIDWSLGINQPCKCVGLKYCVDTVMEKAAVGGRTAVIHLRPLLSEGPRYQLWECREGFGQFCGARKNPCFCQ
jgi:hypothetical protein